MKFEIEISKRAVMRIRRMLELMDTDIPRDHPDEVIQELFFLIYVGRGMVDDTVVDERKHVKVKVIQW
jgi:hypothetical protein